MNKTLIGYVPHGINQSLYYKITDEEGLKAVAKFKQEMVGDADFVVLYNNRNIRRKMTGDVVLAFKEFVKNLPKEKADKACLLFHTHPVDENGTDIPRLVRDVAPEINCKFTNAGANFDVPTMNKLFNISDVIINLASNEGFGLGTAEGMMAEKMIVVNVTGGLQDQCGFKDEEGNYLHEDIHFGAEWGSNHDGRYREHGEWAIPVFPSQRALIGSPPTPYIFDDRCKWEDAGAALLEIYNLTPEERARRGKLGREYLLENGFKSDEMCRRLMIGFDKVFEEWVPRERFTFKKV